MSRFYLSVGQQLKKGSTVRQGMSRFIPFIALVFCRIVDKVRTRTRG